jgi:hypothetical protein
MKLILKISTLLLFCGPFVHADSFTETRDGREYFSQQTGLLDVSRALEHCQKLAVQGPFTQTEARELCANAISGGPADCAKQALQGPFTKAEALKLCSGAVDLGPYDCGPTAQTRQFVSVDKIQTPLFAL